MSRAIIILAMLVFQAYAGNRACDPRQGAPCDKESCNKMAKGQMYCSPVCHKDCCKCPDECNGHQHDPAPSPEQQVIDNALAYLKRQVKVAQ